MPQSTITTVLANEATTNQAGQLLPARLNAVRRGLAHFWESHAATSTRDQLACYQEISWRIAELAADVESLLRLNAVLEEDTRAGGITAVWHPEDRSLHLRGPSGQFMGRLVHTPNDPNAKVDPPRVVASTVKGSFRAGAGRDGDSPQLLAARRELERLLERFYYSAFKVQKLVQQLPGNKKFPYNGITMVRNDLLEHPKDARHPHNFGFGTGGPFVRPARSPGGKDDPGLIANAAAFIEELERRFPVP